jgi:predicted short-subunit dehydrogenase-like oxidoreductase (DUF2520 family)
LDQFDRDDFMTSTAQRPTIAFVGAGRAGCALAVAIADVGYRVVAVNSRSHEHAATLAASIGASVVETPLVAVRGADITFVTIPDQALASLAETVAASGVSPMGHAVVHCSARLGPEVLSPLHGVGADIGVMHPLQAMAGAESAARLRGAYFRVEASGRLRVELAAIVAALDGHILTVPEQARDLYHAAAVLAGNAPLALLARGVDLLESAGVPRAAAHEALATLLEGAAANARAQDPAQALTGPVVRGDAEAVNAHMAALRDHPDALDLYVRLVEEMRRLVEGDHSAKRPALHRVA